MWILHLLIARPVCDSRSAWVRRVWPREVLAFMFPQSEAPVPLPRSLPADLATSGYDDEPPSTPRRHSLWKDIPDHQWDDWKWQQQNAIRSVRQLRGLLSFTRDELEAIGKLEADYKLSIPPYYFSLINTDDPDDPIRLQSVPSPLEATGGFELEEIVPTESFASILLAKPRE